MGTVARSKYLLVFIFLFVATGFIYSQLRENSREIEYFIPSEGASRRLVLRTLGKEPHLVVLKSFPYLFTVTEDSFEDGPSASRKERRMQELVDATAHALSHPLVRHVVLFYLDPLLIPYIQKQNLTHNHKLGYVHNANDSLGPLFQYANEHLKGSVVMVMNADVYPGEGFELFDAERFKKEKLAYVISRHGRAEKHCDLTRDDYSNMCRTKGFIGSMDAYIYSPTQHFKPEYYEYMNYAPHHHGIENLISWVLMQEGRTVLNPCHVLFIYHNHCGMRFKVAEERVDTDGREYKPPPTNMLYR